MRIHASKQTSCILCCTNTFRLKWMFFLHLFPYNIFVSITHGKPTLIFREGMLFCSRGSFRFYQFDADFRNTLCAAVSVPAEISSSGGFRGVSMLLTRSTANWPNSRDMRNFLRAKLHRHAPSQVGTLRHKNIYSQILNGSKQL